MKLKAENIKKAYGDKKVLDNVSINLNNNEIVGLLGVSGIGKTTLFNILSGLEYPDSGKVLLNEEDITGKSGLISYMLQKDLLLPHKTIIDNVSLPLVIKGMKKQEARDKVIEYFKLFGIKGEEYSYPSQLSGGMRQRAALLRTYISSEELVLLDEPFSALDSITRENMQKWYVDVSNKLSLATIFITHDIDEAILMSDRIYILKGTPGKIADEIVIDKEEKLDKDYILSKKFIEYKKLIKDKL